ncbi:MAG: Bor family protein [Gammaproteobacteria bacterium]
MKKLQKHSYLFALCIAVLLTAGCATQIHVLNEDYPIRDKTRATVVGKHNFFVSGIGQSHTTDAAEICGGLENVLQVETQLTFIDILLGTVTYGIYTPRTYRVYCKK